MKYIYLNTDNSVGAVIDEIDPLFPDVPISERYSSDFLSMCIVSETSVPVGYIKTETGFEAPRSPEPGPQPEQPTETVTIVTMDDLAEQVFDLEVRTTMLEQGVK